MYQQDILFANSPVSVCIPAGSNVFFTTIGFQNASFSPLLDPKTMKNEGFNP